MSTAPHTKHLLHVEVALRLLLLRKRNIKCNKATANATKQQQTHKIRNQGDIY